MGDNVENKAVEKKRHSYLLGGGGSGSKAKKSFSLREAGGPRRISRKRTAPRGKGRLRIKLEIEQIDTPSCFSWGGKREGREGGDGESSAVSTWNTKRERIRMAVKLGGAAIVKR